jgi:hypothetical protein
MDYHSYSSNPSTLMPNLDQQQQQQQQIQPERLSFDSQQIQQQQQRAESRSSIHAGGGKDL